MRIPILILFIGALILRGQTVGSCQTQHCTGTGCTTADVTINSTGATMIQMAVSTAAGTDASSVTITDNQANTWGHITSVLDSVSTTQWYAYKKGSGALQTSATHLIHVRGDYAAFTVCPVTGTKTYPDDPFSNQLLPGAHTSSATSLSTGSITCNQPASIIFTSMATHSLGTYAVGSPFTITGQTTYISGNTAGEADGYRVQSSNSPAAATWSGISPAGNISTTIACYASAAALPSVAVKRRFVN